VTISRNGERGRGNRGEDGADMQGPLISEGGRGVRGTGSEGGLVGPRAESRAGPKGFPGSIFIFFSSLLLFLFYFSYFFHRFCKNAPNQFKPLLETSQDSQQGFKPIGNKFSESKQDF
jgi:hypothetical protein